MNILEVQVCPVEIKPIATLLDQNDGVLIDSFANLKTGQTERNRSQPAKGNNNRSTHDVLSAHTVRPTDKVVLTEKL
jgi:hypothetical protein